MCFIIANTTTLALYRYPISSTEYNDLETANMIFTIVFTLEMFIKLSGLGLR